MDTRPVTPQRLAQSVIAVPPLARDSQRRVDREQNTRLIRHIEAGGADILLYGGNANFYHIRPSEYAATLGVLAEAAAPGTLVVPSAGPAYGLSLDQAEVLRDFDFPTVMVLPHTGLNTPSGVETGVRHFAEAFGKPVVLYIKAEGYITPEGAARLVNDGLISWIKYAIVRPDPAQDPFLSELVQKVDPNIIVSGIGEQPAIVHLRDFKCGGFTSGCVCVAPALSQQMLKAIQSGDWDKAESIRETFKPLEDLRNSINPVRVLHEAVALAGIADTGEILPLLSGLEPAQRAAVASAAQALLRA
ncbi:dihydrodipicolinate synthase family protein [Verrucomicrobiota bacterium sgz303538]